MKLGAIAMRRRSCVWVMLGSLFGLCACELEAQRADTLGVPVQTRTTAAVDTVLQPPLAPGKAFLYSFLLPGYSQVTLRRPTALVIFSGMEVVSWSMLGRSILDLRRAKRFARDSVVATWRIDPATGLVVRDPDTGEPVPETFESNEFSGLVSARRTHVEDWAALIVFNHLMAGVDALVAAHLWDLPAQVGALKTPSGFVLTGTIKW